jgi:hypothetical protein
VPALQPVPPAVQPPPAVLPPNLAVHAEDEAVQAPPIDPPTDATHSSPGSTDTLVGGSYPFALLNSKEARYHILPTRGQIEEVRKNMENQGWKFVRLLYQTDMASERTNGFADLHPFKSVLLYVLPNENGQSIDVSSKSVLLSEPY